jgi:hypothetical protein
MSVTPCGYLLQESHRVYPVNMDVISWLGAYHVKNEVGEADCRIGCCFVGPTGCWL